MLLSVSDPTTSAESSSNRFAFRTSPLPSASWKRRYTELSRFNALLLCGSSLQSSARLKALRNSQDNAACCLATSIARRKSDAAFSLSFSPAPRHPNPLRTSGALQPDSSQATRRATMSPTKSSRKVASASAINDSCTSDMSDSTLCLKDTEGEFSRSAILSNSCDQECQYP